MAPMAQMMGGSTCAVQGGNGSVPITYLSMPTPQQQWPEARKGAHQLLDRAVSTVSRDSQASSLAGDSQTHVGDPQTALPLQDAQHLQDVVDAQGDSQPHVDAKPSVPLEEPKKVAPTETSQKNALQESMERLRSLRAKPSLSISKGLAEEEEAVQSVKKAKVEESATKKDAKAMKKSSYEPKAKPSACKAKKNSPKAKAKPKPKSVPAKPKAKAKPACSRAGVKLSREERERVKQRILAGVPLALRRKYADGYVRQCTISCWHKRGDH